MIRISLVERVLKLRPHHLSRLFHPEESGYCENQGLLKYPSYAVRFAAKEAFLKALGRRVPWNQVWVRSTHGRPTLQLSDAVRARFPGIRPLVSLSHDGDYALAFVILISAEASPIEA
jgi:holo-[acyl-carrier protein] synthase